MAHNPTIKGVNFEKDPLTGVYICYIEDFSEELKDEIRKMLNSIWHGSVDAKERAQFNYRNTLKNFLERYQSKNSETKKGMIGELLIHLLLPRYIKFNAISVMKNKEENSIRKGFDIVYCDYQNSIWYCEVKSGGDTSTTEDVNSKNNQLVNDAKRDIQKHAFGTRATLWESVLIDVNLTIFNTEKREEIKKLLDEHHPDAEHRNMDRNVLLGTVLYKSLEEKICPIKLKKHKETIDAETLFVGLIIFSIQKPTYTKIENFLIKESEKEI
jgi:hypothetical protein